MAYKRVTMQDIAAACGLSRNTVSKVFNDRGAVPEATRQMVLQTAQAMGYMPSAEPQPAAAPPAPPPPQPQSRSIALIACQLPSEFHFCTFFVPAFAERLSAFGCTLTVYKITPDELRRRVLPARLPLAQTVGLLAIEVFDRDYMDMVCNTGIPTIFVDAWAGAFHWEMKCDVLSMENIAGIMAVTDQVIARGAKRLGFVGDFTHCNSFLERWDGFNAALSRAGLPLNRNMCIIEREIKPYTDSEWIFSRLQRMPALPDAFICANDYLAICLMTALKKMGVSIPEDVMVAGFDDNPQAAVVEPALTTVHIPSEEIGRIAADMLSHRIQYPGMPYMFAHVKTTPIFRRSTER